MLAFSRELDVPRKTAFVLAHKLREARASGVKGLRTGGEGRAAEVDGACLGGHVRPGRPASGREPVGQAPGRGGDARARWPHAGAGVRRVSHQNGCSVDGACTNGPESTFSRLRRGELGRHHPIAGPYLVRCAQEAAWREDLRRVSNGEQAHGVVGLAMRSSPSVDVCGDWQRAQAAQPIRHEATPAISTRWIVAVARPGDPRTVFCTSAQLRSSVGVTAFTPMTCSVSARVVTGAGASRSTSWIGREHSPGRDQVLRGRCD